MRRATSVLAAGSWPEDRRVATVTLPFHDRHRRRVTLCDDGGEPFLLDLPRAVVLGEGDGLLLEGGGILKVLAAGEAVADIFVLGAADRLRLAWHIGNRHAPLQILTDGGLRIREDGVLAQSLAGLGATVIRRMAPFTPDLGTGGFAHGPDPAATGRDGR